MAMIGAGAYWDIRRQALPDANLITGDPIPGPAGIFGLPMKESLATRRGFRGRMGRNPDRGANGRMVGPRGMPRGRMPGLLRTSARISRV